MEFPNCLLLLPAVALTSLSWMKIRPRQPAFLFPFVDTNHTIGPIHNIQYLRYMIFPGAFGQPLIMGWSMQEYGGKCKNVSITWNAFDNLPSSWNYQTAVALVDQDRRQPGRDHLNAISYPAVQVEAFRNWPIITVTFPYLKQVKSISEKYCKNREVWQKQEDIYMDFSERTGVQASAQLNSAAIAPQNDLGQWWYRKSGDRCHFLWAHRYAASGK